MDRIWAPWRIDYVSQPRKDSEGCFLCAAAQRNRDEEDLVLWRGTHSLCVMNRWPYNNGHLMIAPLTHTADLADLSDEVLLEQMRMLRRARKVLGEVLSPDGFNVGINLGAAAGAGLADHLHWHIVPRWNGDTNFMPVLAETKVIPQSLTELWRLLREADVD
ncbi:MAG: HIT domain-containing protein [Candidatus Brocadiia bacterium]